MDEQYDGWALKRHALGDQPAFYFPVFATRAQAEQWEQNMRREHGYQYSVARLRRIQHTDGGQTLVENPADWTGQE